MDPDRIRINRILQRRSQFSLAREAGISVAYMSMVERGTQPSPEIMRRIEQALGFSEAQEDEDDE